MYLITMGLRYDGHCMTLAWPGLSQGGQRPCSFYDYAATSLETPFWPYTLWQAVAVVVLVTVAVPGMLGLIIERCR